MSIPALDHYATIIAGAGPAGVLAALHAAERGPVLLVESGALPRNKSCGGMLHELSIETLRPYGEVPESIVSTPRTINFRYHDWDRGIRKVTALEFLNVSRAGFDEWLLGLLPDNVEVAPKTTLAGFQQSAERVSVTLADGEERTTATADLLIGADGARSQVRRILGIRESASYVTLQDFITISAPIEPYFDCIYMRDIGDEFAYAYVVPKGDVALIGSVFYPKTKRPWEKQDRVVSLLRERIPQLGEKVHRESAAALFLRSPDDILPGHGRVLLAGEAGGFMSPSSGEGISYALRTGRDAGRAAAGDPAAALDRYLELTAPIRSDIRRRFRWLPFMESRAGKYLAGFVPAPIVSRVTEGL
ncbi:MAG: FAD-dependent monooxygenase [Coriobacteriia bacterium]|nr:FAD-dependent monooxygenase [Coriobacteriia bacterium]